MNFQTHYNRTPTPPEINSGEILVERAGYITAQQRIENMMLAGQRLVDYRKSQFDFDEDQIDEDFTDPTRDPGFDMADASQTQFRINAGIEARLADQQAIEASLKASQTDQEAPDGV